MKNILFIIDSFGIGGAEKALIAQAEEFYKLGYEITCITIYNHILLDIPNFIHLKSLNWKNYKFFKYRRNSKELFKIIDDLNMDFSAIFVHLDKAIRLMKGYNHQKIYNIIHSNLSEQDIAQRKGIKKLIKIRDIKKMYHNLNLITVSKGIEEDLTDNIKIKPKLIQTIYNSVDVSNIKLLSNRSNIIEVDDYIVCVGRLVKVKRHDILLKAFKNADLKTTLVLVGDGEEKNNILQLIKKLSLEDKVILTGFLNNPYPIIKNAKLLVLSSEYEGLPTVLIEALALHVPVCSTNCPSGPNEILTNEFSKYLTNVNDIDDISKKLKLVFENPYVVKDTLIDKFNQNNITEQYLEIIND